MCVKNRPKKIGWLDLSDPLEKNKRKICQAMIGWIDLYWNLSNHLLI
jgi:hypothetical protein